jgi:hypothetical protein
MPRTAVFFDNLNEAFDEKQCTITLDPLDEVRGGVLKVGASLKPYGCDALLRWYDRVPKLPHSRQPIGIDDMHPVMTRHTRIEDYAHAVRMLGVRGWDHAEEVEDDTARRGHKRAHDEDTDGASPIYAMREGLRSSSWWLFVHTEDRREALRQIDQRFLGPALQAEEGDLPQAVALFMAHRERMWAFPPDERPLPIYLNLEDLADELAAIYARATAEEIEAQLRVLVAEDPDSPYRIASIVAPEQEEAFVLNPPNAITWIRGVMLPHDRDGLDWWRVPHPEGDVLDQLTQLQYEPPVQLNFDGAALYDAMTEYFTETYRYAYQRPRLLIFRRPRNEVERWLLRDVIPRMNERGDARPYGSALTHARALKRDLGAECPFSVTELRNAVRRQYEAVRGSMYSLSEADIEAYVREDPTLLPSDPYAEPRLRAVLQHNLGRMDAEARLMA